MGRFKAGDRDYNAPGGRLTAEHAEMLNKADEQRGPLTMQALRNWLEDKMSLAPEGVCEGLRAALAVVEAERRFQAAPDAKGAAEIHLALVAFGALVQR